MTENESYCDDEDLLLDEHLGTNSKGCIYGSTGQDCLLTNKVENSLGSQFRSCS
jgi:hypothetical protein